MQEIVAFQGLGQRDWKSLYQIPEIGTAIRWGQEILISHNIQVEGRPLDLVRACQEGGLVLQEHSQTCWQQPCIFLASMTYWKMWRQKHPVSNPTLLGFSFGEYPAASAAGCFNEETGLLMSAMRGIFTSQAGGSAILVRTRGKVLPIKHLRFHCKTIGEIWLANINSPSQGLIAGQTLKLADMEAYLKVHHPEIHVRPYTVGGAFHTPRMRRARDRFAQWLEQEVKFREPEFPILLNATREITRNPRKIKTMLPRQLTARLNFKKLAETLPRDVELHEICVGQDEIIGPLVRQTHRFKYAKEGVLLKALPFPA